MSSPFILDRSSVTQVMAWVLAALLPGIAVYVWLFGPGILVTLSLATLAWRLCPDSEFSVIVCMVLWAVMWMTYLRVRHARLIHKIWAAVQGNLAPGSPLDELRV